VPVGRATNCDLRRPYVSDSSLSGVRRPPARSDTERGFEGGCRR
jgi:hypothetical protein